MNMKRLVLLPALAAGLVVHPPVQSESAQLFDEFIFKYGRSYAKGTDEYNQRLELFSDRLQKAHLLNSEPSRAWKAGTSPFADYTPEELKQLKGWKGTARRSSGNLRTKVNLLQTDDLPENWQKWRNLESLKLVADQGPCGSCWAVTTATVLTTHREIHRNITDRLSTQELVACVPNPRNCGGSGGCSGATVELAMAYTLQNGLELAEVHPYKGFSTLQMHVWEKLPENKYQPLMHALVTKGPVAVSASADGWEMYMSGIFGDCSKDATINHAVTLIGYGKDDVLKQKYWTIMNSWGENFGEMGTMRLLRHDAEEEFCGTDHQPEVGTGCDGGPSSVRVCGMCGILYDSVVPVF